MSLSELIQRYLTALDVPENEWARQGDKLSLMEEGELRREVEALERIFESAEARIVSGSELWAEEEAERRALICAGFPEVREWLSGALIKTKIGEVDPFAPFQDQIDPKRYAYDLYRFYLGIPHRNLVMWMDAIVDLASDALVDAPSNELTVRLLRLVGRIDGLYSLAANSRLAPSLLSAHRSGHVEIPVRLLLRIFATACAKSSESWVLLARLVDFDFKLAYGSNSLSDGDFKKLGDDIAALMPRADLLDKIGTLRVAGWRALVFSSFVPELPLGAVQTVAPKGICIDGFNAIHAKQKIEAMLELVQ